MKKLEKLFYNFLWNGGPDRIKRTIVIKDLQAGGLRMINAQYFIKALKITWLRKVIKIMKVRPGTIYQISIFKNFLR